MLERIRRHKVSRFLIMLWHDFMKLDIFKDASAMAFVTLLSLIPSLAATFALISLFTPLFGQNSALISDARIFILKNLATGSGEQAIQYLENFLANTDFTKIGATGFGGMIVTLTLLLKQIEEALNRIFEVRQPRTILERFLYFWTFLTLGTLCLGLSIGALSSFAWSSSYIDVTVSTKVVQQVGYLGGILLFFFLTFKFGPNRYIPWRPSLIGALVSTTLLVQAIRFFSLYVTGFTRYQAVYGALAALPIFMVWLQFIWLITLLGALVAKRLMDGLPHSHFRSAKVQNSIRDEYFEIVLPILVLVKTYESYEQHKGKGASPDWIAKELFVSGTVVNAAFTKLQTADLVIPHHLNGSRGHNDVYFPRVPPHELNFREVKSKLLGSTEAWIENIRAPHEDLRAEYADAVHAFLQGEERDFATVIARAKPS